MRIERTCRVEDIVQAEWDVERDRIVRYLESRMDHFFSIGLPKIPTLTIQELTTELLEGQHREPVQTNAELWR